MSIKRNIRRRSNWYIYLLTFIITFVILSFVVYNIWDYLFPARNMPAMSNGSLDSRPDASFNTTFLFMLSEKKGSIPDYYILMNYRPRDDVILLVPLKARLYAKVGNTSGTLTDLYASGGTDSVILAIQNALGVKPQHYIKFDKDSFIDFFDTAGNTPINVPADLQGGEIEFFAGLFEFTGEMLYAYLTYPDYNQGEDYRYMVHGMAIANFINKNSRNLTVTRMQTLFNKVLNTTDTSLDFSDFTKNQQAYLYTTQNSFNIADYYIPTGTVDEFGQFTVSESTITTIKERFGLNRED